ncbi:MAG TPA: ModE family transcriptional regulator [Casimicrobiaceae bacterium]
MKAGIRFHIRGEGERTELAIGPGKVALLEAIAQTGSITSAARQLGMSYRRAWLLVDETNRCLVRPAVTTVAGGQKGGGTVLTPAGAELVRRYRALEHATELAVGRKFKSMLRMLPSDKGPSDN